LRSSEGFEERPADWVFGTPFSEGVIRPANVEVRRNDGDPLVERADDVLGAFQPFVRAGTARAVLVHRRHVPAFHTEMPFE
jgi:hypothetical protein